MTTSAIQPQIFKQNRNKWWLVVCLLAMSGALPLMILTTPTTAGHSSRETLGFYFFIAVVDCVFLLPAIYCALDIWCGFLQIDERGLRWRSIRRERTATWNEITDFYEKPTGKGRLLSVVETLAGKLTLNDFLDDSADLLLVRETVQSHATSAASTRWQTKADKAAIPLPKTFVYKSSEWWVMRIMLAGLYLAMPLMMLLAKSGSPTAGWNNLIAMLRDFYALYSWPMVALFCLTMLAVCSMYPLMFTAMIGPQMRATKARLRQRITASERGLTFLDDNVFLEAAWEECEYSRENLPGRLSRPGLYVVQTPRGNFDFVVTMSDCKTLLRLLQERAPQPQEASPRDPELSDLGGATAQWSGGEIGKGKRIFRYRTRMNRALLWMPTGIALAPLLAALLFRAMPELAPPRHDGSGFFIGGVLLLLAFFGWIPYFKSQIRVGENGITARGWRGETFLAWREVREYSRDETYGAFRVFGTEKHITFWPLIADAAELKTEIARRATNAEKRGWEANEMCATT